MTEKVISFHYTLKDPQGNVLDKSDESEPLSFLTGMGMIIPGLEKALLEMEEGENSTINVPSTEAYGERSEEKIGQADRNHFPEDIEVGQMFAVDEEGTNIVTITAFDDENVTLDGNHPLAGVDLSFEVEIVENREASPEEIDHGHVHADGEDVH